MTDFSKVREAWNTLVNTCKEMQEQGGFGFNPSTGEYHSCCESCPLEVICKVETKYYFENCMEFDEYYE